MLDDLSLVILSLSQLSRQVLFCQIDDHDRWRNKSMSMGGMLIANILNVKRIQTKRHSVRNFI